MKRAGERGKTAIRHLLFSLLSLLIVTAGCGKKSDPRAPELAIAETIEDLRGQAEQRGVVLTWSRPARYVGGRELTDLAAFVIFRKELSPTCLDCPAPYRERIAVSVEDQDKFIRKKQFRFVDQQLAPKMVYRYRIFSQLTDGSLSEPSNEIEVAWRP